MIRRSFFSSLFGLALLPFAKVGSSWSEKYGVPGQPVSLDQFCECFKYYIKQGAEGVRTGKFANTKELYLYFETTDDDLNTILGNSGNDDELIVKLRRPHAKPSR